ncbi:MAG: sensor histidine kinase [Ignavibacteria bacterium]
MLSKIKLHQFIDEVFQLARANVSNKQITFINKTDDIYLIIDPDKFKQVLLNLIQNSIDAIETNGEIEISTIQKETSVSIYVKDNGTGINEPEKIFDPFFTTKNSGTGLGLSVSQRIIEQHEGSLKLISSRKGETIFEINLLLNDSQGKL